MSDVQEALTKLTVELGSKTLCLEIVRGRSMNPLPEQKIGNTGEWGEWVGAIVKTFRENR